MTPLPVECWAGTVAVRVVVLVMVRFRWGRVGVVEHALTQGSAACGYLVAGQAM